MVLHPSNISAHIKWGELLEQSANFPSDFHNICVVLSWRVMQGRSALTATPYRLPDAITLPTPTCLCGSLPVISGQTTMVFYATRACEGLLNRPWVSLATSQQVFFSFLRRCRVALTVPSRQAQTSCIITEPWYYARSTWPRPTP